MLLGAAVLGCAPRWGGGTGTSPQSLLERAIVQAGGSDALSRAYALIWEGDAIVETAGRVVHITGSWAVQPPDTAVVATYDVARGTESTRALVVAAPRGWLMRGQHIENMPTEMLANERDEFYLYHVMRLVTLRDPGTVLSSTTSDSLGQPGLRAEVAGRPTVDLFFDGAARLAHLRTRVRNPSGPGAVAQDLWFTGIIEADGVRWPREIRITMDGVPYFTVRLRSLRVQRRVDDPRLRGPR